MTADASVRPVEAGGRSAASALVISAALALVLVASQAAIVLLYGGVEAGGLRGAASILPLIALLALPMLALLAAARSIDRLPSSGAAIALVGVVGLAMRLPYFGAPPVIEDDHYRYLLDGALLASG
ncbi:MAG: hypothetical protein ACRCTI_15160, partial [Beijerinckiaceae bacterium]